MVERKRSPDFETDGCSWSPDFNFRCCCIRHDIDYWAGGTKQDRLEADQRMRDCIRSYNRPILAWIYYIGVRIFGNPNFPVISWKWTKFPPWKYRTDGTWLPFEEHERAEKAVPQDIIDELIEKNIKKAKEKCRQKDS